jgi:hypothetical protein
VGEVLEEDVDGVDAETLELLAGLRSTMDARGVELVTHDDTEVLESHPVDALMNGRDELDAQERSPVENLERLGWASTNLEIGRPFHTSSRFAFAWALEECPLVDVEIPSGSRGRRRAERVGRPGGDPSSSNLT